MVEAGGISRIPVDRRNYINLVSPIICQNERNLHKTKYQQCFVHTFNKMLSAAYTSLFLAHSSRMSEFRRKPLVKSLFRNRFPGIAKCDSVECRII